MSKNPLDKKIGILGAGQLGKMLFQASTKLNLDIRFLDSSAEVPVGRISDRVHIGNFKEYDDVIAFGADKDVISIEIEAVNVDALQQLEKDGKQVFPQPSVVRLIQDKGTQKQFFESNGLVSPPFQLVETKQDLQIKIDSSSITFPFVQKLRRDGYDGRGVCVIKDKQGMADAFDAPCVIEDLVDISKEISVIVARSQSGEIAVYDPVEMVVNPEANLLDYQMAPAAITAHKSEEAQQLAIETATKLEIVGLLAVELFLDKNDDLWINELAPRAHNSGHHTIEACQTSQYEQQLRCILGLPLGSTALLSPSLLMNILGEPDHTGVAIYQGLEQCLDKKGVHPHLYGKTVTKPMRKMGHINIVNTNLEEAKEIYRYIKSTLKVISHE
jgi:5-(carboxyamino)imidazole ribonucleotide synthase